MKTIFYSLICLMTTFCHFVLASGSDISRSVASLGKVSDRAELDSTQRPNFLLIVVDDLGYSDLGIYGSEINTPNLDRLARSGTLFTSFYTASVCSPTRAMLLSGIDNHLVGLGNMVESMAPNQQGQQGYEGYLNFRIATLAELLKDGGYHTYMTGKWHLGMEPETSPAARGFEHSFALLEGGAGHFDDLAIVGPGNASYRENGQISDLPERFYSTRFYTDRMVEYIDSNKNDNKPFFAYVAYTAPHWPLQAPDDSIQKYRDKYNSGYDVIYEQRLRKMKALGLIDNQNKGVPREPGEPAWEELSDIERKVSARKMEIYAAMIDDVDHYIGELIDYLKSVNQFDNTFIFFMSDNGPEGHHLDKGWPAVADWIVECCDNSYANLGKPNSYTWYGPNWGRVSAAPFRFYKGFTSEGGIRVPAFVSYQNKLQSNVVFQEIVTVKDVMPTILELAGVAHPNHYNGNRILPIQGQSMLPVLKKMQNNLHGEDFILGTESFGKKAIRKGDWKILSLPPPHGTGEWQLFNLRADPSEMHNLSLEYPQKLIQLEKLWQKYVNENNVIIQNTESLY